MLFTYIVHIECKIAIIRDRVVRFDETDLDRISGLRQLAGNNIKMYFTNIFVFHFMRPVCRFTEFDQNICMCYQ